MADFKQDFDEFSTVTTALKILLAFHRRSNPGHRRHRLMNIMLVSVQQRTREIGIEKSLGAHKHHILLQFLAEALAITFAGGLAGIAIAYIISWTVGALPLMSAFGDNLQAGDIHLTINLSSLVVATIILQPGRHRQRHGPRHPRPPASIRLKACATNKARHEPCGDSRPRLSTRAKPRVSLSEDDRQLTRRTCSLCVGAKHLVTVMAEELYLHFDSFLSSTPLVPERKCCMRRTRHRATGSTHRGRPKTKLAPGRQLDVRRRRSDIPRHA